MSKKIICFMFISNESSNNKVKFAKKSKKNRKCVTVYNLHASRCELYM